MSTTRNAKIQIINNFGQTVFDVVFSLSSSAHSPYIIAMDEMPDQGESHALPITFETGSAPAYDHWSIAFTDSGGKIWHTPNDDRCNISESETGTTIRNYIDYKVNGEERPSLNIGVENGCRFKIVTK